MNLETVMQVEPGTWFLVWCAGALVSILPSGIIGMAGPVTARRVAAFFARILLWPVAWPVWALWRIGRWVYQHSAARLRERREKPGAEQPVGVEAWRINDHEVALFTDGKFYLRHYDEWLEWPWTRDPSFPGAERLSSNEAIVLNNQRAERLATPPDPDPWGAEGYQRAYRDRRFPDTVLRFYPSGGLFNMRSRVWGANWTGTTEATCLEDGDTRLSDAEALEIWRTRPGVLQCALPPNLKAEDLWGEKTTPAPYSLNDARAEGLSKRIGKVERRLDEIERDRQ